MHPTKQEKTQPPFTIAPHHLLWKFRLENIVPEIQKGLLEKVLGTYNPEITLKKGKIVISSL